MTEAPISTPRARRDRRDVEAALRRSRAELSTSLDEFQRALEHSVTPRQWLRTHPWACLIGAFALGALLGRR